MRCVWCAECVETACGSCDVSWCRAVVASVLRAWSVRCIEVYVQKCVLGGSAKCHLAAPSNPNKSTCRKNMIFVAGIFVADLGP